MNDRPPKVSEVILARKRGEPGAEEKHLKMSSAGGHASQAVQRERREVAADLREAEQAADLSERVTELAKTEKIVDGDVLPPDPAAPQMVSPIRGAPSPKEAYRIASRGE